MYMYNTYIYPYNSLQTFLLFVVARRRHGGSEGLAFTPRVYVYTYVSTRITHFKLSFCVPPVTWRRHGRAEGLALAGGVRQRAVSSSRRQAALHPPGFYCLSASIICCGACPGACSCIGCMHLPCLNGQECRGVFIYRVLLFIMSHFVFLVVCVV